MCCVVCASATSDIRLLCILNRFMTNHCLLLKQINLLHSFVPLPVHLTLIFSPEFLQSSKMGFQYTLLTVVKMFPLAKALKWRWWLFFNSYLIHQENLHTWFSVKCHEYFKMHLQCNSTLIIHKELYICASCKAQLRLCIECSDNAIEKSIGLLQ